MGEAVLRLTGLLGRLKALAIVLLIGGAILFVAGLANLAIAGGNAAGPQVVAPAQIVDGEVGHSSYVTVSGMAFYGDGYRESSDGKVVAEYYFLVDPNDGSAVLVKAAEVGGSDQDPAEATITGMIRSTASDLKSTIETDVADMEEVGLSTITKVYLAEGEKPLSSKGSMTMIVAGIVALLLALASFLSPSTVFAPSPLEPVATGPVNPEPGTQVTGQFQQMFDPPSNLKFGKRRQKFVNAVGNVVDLADGQVMIYIHHIMTTKVYGATVGRRETHWGIVLDRGAMVDIVPGKVYGGKARPAVRLRYTVGGRQQTLFVSFNHSAAQASMVNLLQQKGFVVSTGEAALAGA